MSDLGTGIFQLTSEPAGQSADHDIRAEYFARLRNLALSSGIPISFGVGPTAGGKAAMQLIDEVCEQGGHMFGLSHSRGISVITSFKTRMAFDNVTEWKEFRALPLDEQKHLLRDDAVRARLVHAAHHGDYGRPIGAEARKPDYDRMRVFDNPLVPMNRTVAEVAAQRGIDPVELIIDLALETNMEQFFVQPLTPGTTDDLVPVMRHPRSVMTFSDSGAHVSQIADFSIQTHLLAYWVRERQVFSIEEAVRMLTLAPSAAWGFHDRGLLREGLRADLNVFDPGTVGPEMPTVAHDLPGGARRLVQRASGFKATVVNGQVLIRDGAHAGAYPGQIVRGRLAVAR